MLGLGALALLFELGELLAVELVESSLELALLGRGRRLPDGHLALRLGMRECELLLQPRLVELFDLSPLALTTLVLAGLHMGVTEDTRAGHVILGRTLLSCACSVFFAAMLACDANSLK